MKIEARIGRGITITGRTPTEPEFQELPRPRIMVIGSGHSSSMNRSELVIALSRMYEVVREAERSTADFAKALRAIQPECRPECGLNRKARRRGQRRSREQGR